ncbi:MBL fold metallo-hydrolase [Terrarubrum flagellatum]|uniref:MBL fold metallo-hydrolase n=1 Tax=Terrirubrum flagellatum TaxID=2895980 RepID=UPI003144DA3B
MSLSRRQFTTGLALGASSFTSAAAFAKAPMQSQVAPIYRTKVGDLQVTAIADGYLDLEMKLFPFAAQSPQATAKLLAAARVRDPVRTFVNAYVVNTGSKLILIDTGTGNAMGPSLGALQKNLAAAGFKPEDVDLILLTHMHPDHVNGLPASDGKAAFPNAELLVSQQDWAFWMDEAIASRAPADAQPFFKIARDAVKPYAGKVRQFTAPTEVSPGIQALPAPGHTVGHTMYRISSGKDQLLIWGDIVHVQALQFARPGASLAFDTDQSLAASTRKRVFDMAAKDRVAVAGMHLSFPGIGYVERHAGDYAYSPVSFAPAI